MKIKSKPMETMDIEFEKAVRFLVEYLPVSEEGSRKPVLLHDLRVGMYLYEHNYYRDVVLAGLLHDALEWSGVTAEKLSENFGENIFKLVKACSKDRTISDPQERIEDMIRRCVASGQEALIVKAADTLDSFKHYTKTGNEKELDYIRKNAEAIFKYKPESYSDRIFDELEKWKK